MFSHFRFVIASVFAGLVAGTTDGRAADIAYRNVEVDGVRIAYREIGDVMKPAVLLLHGVPSSSRMYERLMRMLGERYHMVAPDYPGFGNSAVPEPAEYVYTFDHLSQTIQRFTDLIGLSHYTLFMQDYGAPVGMRLATAHPGAIDAMVFQNGNIYEEGLGAVWESRKAFWKDRAANEAAVIKGHQSVETTRSRHIGSDSNIQAYDPDLWMDEWAYLNRPGQGRIQADLIYDYQNNIAAYPAWQGWLREHRVPTLVIWGKHDQAFTVPGALAFRRDAPKAQVHILDGGHFVMDTRLTEVAKLTDRFLHAAAQVPR